MLTLNGGGSGGVFTPSLYIGAVTGGAFGVAMSRLFPGLGLHPEAYALVGMGALIAGATDAPITGILIVFEMTDDYAIVLPLMLTTVICHAIARRLEPDSLYSGWLRRRGERLDAGTDESVLAGLRVAHAYEPAPRRFATDTPIAVMLEQLGDQPGDGAQSTFPVVDEAGTLRGVVTVADLGRAVRDDVAIDVLIAADLAGPTETVTLTDTLLETIRRLGVRGASALPVVEEGTGRLVGIVSRASILALYERTLTGSGPGASPAQVVR